MTDSLSVRIELDRIHCHDEGDGLGSAEPYLWTVFFKVDATSVSVNSSQTGLDGEGTISTTPGSHGNLGDTDVDEGDDITIPAVIGEWTTLLVPIPVPPPLNAIQPDISGTVGVVCVLMEEDNVTDDGAAAGHVSLNEAVRAAINQVVATRTVTNQDITDQELAEFEEQIADAVESGVTENQNLFEDLWSWLNADDKIGFKVFMFKSSELESDPSIDFSHRWESNGDWEIFGNITVTGRCAADAAAALFEAVLGDASRADRRQSDTSEIDLDAMRQFRDETFAELPGLARWWRLASRNAPALALLAARDRSLAEELAHSARYISSAVSSPAEQMNQDELVRLERVASQLAKTTRSRQLRKDASRVADVAGLLGDVTVEEAIRLLATVPPARYPNVEGVKGLRISKSS